METLVDIVNGNEDELKSWMILFAFNKAPILLENYLQIAGQPVLFNLGMATGLGERKLYSNLLNFASLNCSCEGVEPLRHELYDYLPSISLTIQVRRIRHAWHY